jgi:hypothetical protein
MNRRSFIGAILALGAAPAIVRASSLMGFKETASPILLHQAQDIVIATQMPTQEEVKKLWPGADLASDYSDDEEDNSFGTNDQCMYIRDDGIIVMCRPSHAAMTAGGPHPLKLYDGVLRDNPKRVPSGRRMAAESRFNFLLGTFR